MPPRFLCLAIVRMSFKHRLLLQSARQRNDVRNEELLEQKKPQPVMTGLHTEQRTSGRDTMNYDDLRVPGKFKPYSFAAMRK